MTTARGSAPSSDVTIEQIPAKRLSVDPTVQRGFDPGRAERINADFDENALGVFTVSRRADGTEHLVDGQHRHGVIILRGEEDRLLDCQVHHGLTTQQEARMFRLLNNAKPVSVLDRFVVRIKEEDPTALAINSVLTEHGWRLSTAKLDGCFAAVASIEAPYTRAQNARGAGTELVDWVISVVTKAWGHNSSGVRQEIITGLSHLYLRHGSAIDTAKLVAELAQFAGGPRGIIAQAKSLREFRGGTIGDAMAERMVNLINKGRRLHRLPDWRDADV
jgi:hypothetical protein